MWAHLGLSAPGGGNRKDVPVWGFTIENGKNARKLYSIFPAEIITLHRTKRKQSKQEVRTGPSAPGPELQGGVKHRASRSEVCTSTAGGRGVPTPNLNFVEAREKDFHC